MTGGTAGTTRQLPARPYSPAPGRAGPPKATGRCGSAGLRVAQAPR